MRLLCAQKSDKQNRKIKVHGFTFPEKSTIQKPNVSWTKKLKAKQVTIICEFIILRRERIGNFRNKKLHRGEPVLTLTLTLTMISFWWSDQESVSFPIGYRKK